MREGMGFEMLKIGALFLNILVLSVVAAEADKTAAAVNLKVGVVLDLNVVGKMGLSCTNMTLSDFYANRSYYKTKLILNPMDSNGTNYCWCNYNRFIPELIWIGIKSRIDQN
uniref:Uncharacterized protein n=1 Tax=Cucumis sativus TaxID=3659 RepID=A0A0A0KCD3_CUCSA